MEVCRACLSNEANMVPLDETFVTSYNLLTNLNVMLFDGMSQYSCSNCVTIVKSYVEFREKCITSESTLQQNLLQGLQEFKSDQKIFLDLNVENITPIKIFKGKKEKVKKTKRAKKKESHSKNNTCMNFTQDNSKLNFDNTNGVSDCPNIKQEIKVEKYDEVSIFEADYEAFEFENTGFFMKNEEVDDVKPKKLKKTKKKRVLDLLSDIKPLRCIKTEDSDKELLCGLCNKSFKPLALTEHVESHKKDSHCYICQDPFNTWPSLLAHRMLHLPKDQPHCHICPKFYKSPTYLEGHYLKVHYEGEKPKITCKFCLRTYPNLRKLNKHIWGSHSTKSFICDCCNRSFNTRQSLMSHIRSFNNKKEYVCDLCGFSCNYSGGLKGHILRKHTTDRVYCKTCTSVFENQEKLNAHVCKDLDKVCPICGKQIFTTKNLTRHMQTHWEVGRYKCDRCPALYKTKQALKVHINRHDDVRPLKCEFCPRTFFSAPVLIKHRRVHTGEKPYVCKICQKGFTGNHNLKVHMKVHGEDLIVKRNKDPVSNDIILK